MSNNSYSVAILLAAYNGSKWIHEQLKSLLSQKGVSVHIFISVDLSDDNTFLICSEFSKNHPNIYLFPCLSRFGSAAQNFFFLLSNVAVEDFDFVSFSDQDDIWFDNKLIFSIEAMSINKCDAFSSNVIAFWEDGKSKLIKKSYPQVEWDFLFEAAGPGCTYVFSNELSIVLKNLIINNPSDFSKVFLHDWFVYAYARANGYSWHIDDTPTMFYRQHKKNLVGVNDSFRSLIYRFNLVFNKLGFDQSLLIANLIGINDNKILKYLNKLDFFSLIILSLNTHLCRRRPFDKFLFFVFCIFYSAKLLILKFKRYLKFSR